MLKFKQKGVIEKERQGLFNYCEQEKISKSTSPRDFLLSSFLNFMQQEL